MKGKYKAAIALLLLLFLVPLTLLMTLAQWVPTLAGIWLPLERASRLKKPTAHASRPDHPRSPLSGRRV